MSLPLWSNPRGPKPQRIADHRDGAEAHRSGSNHWIQQQSECRKEHASGQRYTHGVIDEGKEEILFDIARLLRPYSSGVLRRVSVEAALAANAAEEVPLALVLACARRSRGIHLHPTDGISCRRFARRFRFFSTTTHSSAQAPHTWVNRLAAALRARCRRTPALLGVVPADLA